MDGIKQLTSVLFGGLTMLGIFIFESAIFGGGLWLAWNLFDVHLLFGLGFISYIQAVGVVFMVKILKFDSSNLKQPQPTQIIIPNSALKKDDQPSE